MYFTNCNNIEELKSEFKALASVHHPAKGGFLKVWELINAEYQTALNKPVLADPDTVPANSPAPAPKVQPAQANQASEEIIKDKALQASKLPNVRVVISGVWVWVTGETKQSKFQLKTLGFTWARKQDEPSAWFFRTGENKSFKRRNSQRLPLGQIEMKYGAQEV